MHSSFSLRRFRTSPAARDSIFLPLSSFQSAGCCVLFPGTCACRGLPAFISLSLYLFLSFLCSPFNPLHTPRTQSSGGHCHFTCCISYFLRFLSTKKPCVIDAFWKENVQSLYRVVSVVGWCIDRIEKLLRLCCYSCCCCCDCDCCCDCCCWWWRRGCCCRLYSRALRTSSP